jgi:8-oxo-dGTP pyrophosphatase MutT (NUDIX family)
VGSTYAGWLRVANLWVDADLRRQGMAAGCSPWPSGAQSPAGAIPPCSTRFSFQAPEFYPRFGYRSYAMLDYTPAHQRLFMRKLLLMRKLLPGGFVDCTRAFPVSIKGVLFEAGRVVLLENKRSEWELPGGRLEPGEDPPSCLAREVAEELGAVVTVEAILDSWLYPVLPQREVLIVTYGLRRTDLGVLRVSTEHRRLGRFALGELDGLPMPDGYRRSIRSWAAYCDRG